MLNSRFNTRTLNTAGALRFKWFLAVVVMMVSVAGNAQLRGYSWNFADNSTTVFKGPSVITGTTDTLQLSKMGGGSFASSSTSENVGLGANNAGPIPVRQFTKPVGLEFLNSPPQLVTTTYTIEMVISLSDNGTKRRLMGFYDLSSANGGRGVFLNTSGNIDFYTNNSNVITGTTLNANTWYQVVFTRNSSGVISCYVNGNLAGTFNDSQGNFIPHSGATSYNIITFLRDNAGAESSGKIAKLSIYNEVLSSTSIQDLFNNVAAAGIESWKTTGNSNTTSSSFLGTKDNQPLIFKANNAEVFRVAPSGEVGIGITSPLYKLDVNGALRIGSLSADPSGAAGAFYYNSAKNTFKGYANGAWKNFIMEGDTIISLNGLSGKKQFFVTGTSGNNFNISSNDSVHTFNMPDASDTSRGLVSMGTQTFAGLKSFSALASGGIAPPTTGLTKMVITDANGLLSFATTPAGGDAYLNGTQTFLGANTFSNSDNKFTGLLFTDTTQQIVAIKADGTLVRSTKFVLDTTNMLATKPWVTSMIGNSVPGTVNVDTTNKSVYTASIGAIARPNSNFFGYRAGNGAIGASSSNFFGYQAGYGAVSVDNANFFGLNAGRNATNAYASNFFGHAAGDGATNAWYSNFLGYKAGLGSTWGYYSNYIGFEAGRNATAAAGSNFIGRNAGYNATNAAYSVFLGYLAGADAAQARNSIFIGEEAGNEGGLVANNTNNGQSDYSILIGRHTRTGGKKNSVLIGGSTVPFAPGQNPTFITNTADNQFMLAPNISKLRFKDFDYDLATDTLATRAYVRSIASEPGTTNYKQIEVNDSYTVAPDITHVIIGVNTFTNTTITLPDPSVNIGRKITVSTEGTATTISPAYRWLKGTLTGNLQPHFSVVEYISDGTYWHKNIGSYAYTGASRTNAGAGGIDIYPNMGIFPGNASMVMYFKKLRAGNGINLADSSGNIIISATSSGPVIDSTKWSTDSINIYNKNIGNVGIGTINPTAKLHTVGSLRFESYKNNSQGDSVLSTDADGNLKMVYLNQSGSGFGVDSTKWGTDSINVFNKNSGNIGIGTITPTAKFHTLGSLRFESFKNNEQGDSVLTTDTNGNLKFIYMPYGSTGGGDSTGGVSYTFKNGVTQSNGHVSIGGSLLDSVRLNLNGQPFNFNSGAKRIFSFTPNGALDNGMASYDLTANSTKFNIGVNQDSAGYGGQLSFNGSGNSDPLWVSRFNALNDASEIRMNIGDEGGSGDKFHVGYQSGGSWNSKFVVQANGQAGVGTSELNGDLSVGKQHGDKLSIGNSGWANKTIIATGIDGQSDYTEIKVPGAAPNSAYLRINNEGSVGIGTTLTDAGYKLLVNGRIKAVGLRVKAYTNWPDYVFDSTYQLKPLAEVENFIKTNKHLPEMPTADEVDKEGHDVSEIQIKLVQKIEELTLYIIEQEKRVKELEDKNKKLDEQNKQILQLQQQLDELKKLILKTN